MRRVDVDKLAEAYALKKRVKKPLSYAAKLIIVLSVTAAIVIASVTCLSVYLTGGFDIKGNVSTDNGEPEQEIYTEGFIAYQFNSGRMPAGYYAKITLNADDKDYTIEAYLFSQYAPTTVNNFIAYAKKGFYNGKTFGEVTLGYNEDKVPVSGRILCGGWKRTQAGNLVYEFPQDPAPIKGEFLENGYTLNKLSNTAGVIGMVHNKDNDDATTDFYILPFDDLSLNGRYAAFAKIVDNTDIGLIRSLAKRAYEQDLVVTIKEIKIYER